MKVLGLGLSRLNYFVSLGQEYKRLCKYLKYVIKGNEQGTIICYSLPLSQYTFITTWKTEFWFRILIPRCSMLLLSPFPTLAALHARDPHPDTPSLTSALQPHPPAQEVQLGDTKKKTFQVMSQNLGSVIV